FVVFRTRQLGGDFSDVYEFADKLCNHTDPNDPTAAAIFGEPRRWSCSLQLLDKALGFLLRVATPAAQQLIASEDWTDAGPTPEELDPTNAENRAVSFRDMIACV